MRRPAPPGAHGARVSHAVHIMGCRPISIPMRALICLGCLAFTPLACAPHGGEVDIVCRDKRHGELVFVEVKTRSGEEFGRPLDAVDKKKRQLILRGAMKWLHLLGMPDITYRFDVVEVVVGRSREVRHIENAFQVPEHFVY